MCGCTHSVRLEFFTYSLCPKKKINPKDLNNNFSLTVVGERLECSGMTNFWRMGSPVTPFVLQGTWGPEMVTQNES